MRVASSLILIALILIATPACKSSDSNRAEFRVATPQQTGVDPIKLQGLVDLAQRFVDEDRLIGAEMLIIKDRKIVLHEAVGWSDKEAGIPLARNSIYRVRSMTKPFTGTATLMLIDQGRLSLDSRPSQYFQSWDNDRCRSITVRQLLTHRSGFEQSSWPIPASSCDNLQQLVDACGGQGPQHTPGERFIYSDVNSFTLGAIIAHITGEPIESFIQRKILSPVGLTDTHTAFTTDAPWASRMNPTYDRDDVTGQWFKYWTPDQPQDFRYFRASGGLYSTTMDYARWMSCWMDATRLPGQPSKRLLSQPIVDAALQSYGSDQYGGYGYHWGLNDGEPFTFGHSGSDGTMAIAVPSLDLIVVYFTQSRGGETLDEWRRASWQALKPD